MTDQDQLKTLQDILLAASHLHEAGMDMSSMVPFWDEIGRDYPDLVYKATMADWHRVDPETLQEVALFVLYSRNPLQEARTERGDIFMFRSCEEKESTVTWEQFKGAATTDFGAALCILIDHELYLVERNGEIHT